MLWALIVLLLVLWLFGFLATSLGAIVHVLLVLALIVLLFQLFMGRRAI